MSQYEIFFNPAYEVVLEGAFDNLVEYVRGDDLVYVRLSVTIPLTTPPVVGPTWLRAVSH